MSLSLNNSTIVPLLSGNTFLGQTYDNILDFAEINIAIKCDTGYDLTFIYSQDKLSIDYQTTQSITSQLETQFYKIAVNDRYFKLKIQATDGDMSVLNVQTIYKSNTTFNNSGSGPTSNVAITSPLNGDGSVDVAVSNFPATQAVSNGSLSSMTFSEDNLNVYDSGANTSLDNIYNIVNSRGTSQLYNGAIIAGGSTNVLNLSSINVKNLTMYGNQDSNGNILSLLFSNDGITFYLSQYSYSFGALVSGNFGFNVQCCPRYIRVQSTNACNLTLFVDYC